MTSENLQNVGMGQGGHEKIIFGSGCAKGNPVVRECNRISNGGRGGSKGSKKNLLVWVGKNSKVGIPTPYVLME